MSELKAKHIVDVYDTYSFSPYKEEAQVYLKSDVDAAIAELKGLAEDASLERDDNQNVIDELQAENAELKQKLEQREKDVVAQVAQALAGTCRAIQGDKVMKFTIEEVLEISVKHIHDACRDDEQNKQAYKDLMLVCAGIVAGIKSVKQERQDDDTLSSSSEAE